MPTSILIAIAVVAVIVGAILTIATLVKQRSVQQSGTITIITPLPPSPELKFNLYEGEACSTVLNEIVWGDLESGDIARALIHFF